MMEERFYLPSISSQNSNSDVTMAHGRAHFRSPEQAPLQLKRQDLSGSAGPFHEAVSVECGTDVPTWVCVVIVGMASGGREEAESYRQIKVPPPLS